MDKGDPDAAASFRDRILMLKAPFSAKPVELTKLQHRFSSLEWFENSSRYVHQHPLQFRGDPLRQRWASIDSVAPGLPAA